MSLGQARLHSPENKLLQERQTESPRRLRPQDNLSV